MAEFEQLEAVRLDAETGELVLLDQTLLPGEVAFLRLRTVESLWRAIRTLQVRGAPAIGIAAGYGMYLAARHSTAATYADLRRDLVTARGHLAASRPTAVNLFWALERMVACLDRNSPLPVPDIKQALLAEADAIREEDVRMCRALGEYGLSLLRPGMGILTHCNAGRLAAGGCGTALAPVYAGHERNYNFRVFADETRPLLQGARLTTFELHAAGVDVTLICDNMASMVMKKGWVQAVLVGCDRVAKNGDVANKIGTSGVAILANRHRIPFYVCAPSSTIDMACPNGDAIAIEERDPDEITTMWYQNRMAPAGIGIFNPAFDVTDSELVTAIITERGIARAPYGEAFKAFGLHASRGL